MKKIFLTIVAVLCYVATAVAEPVTESEAREKAARFVLSLKGDASSARSAQRLGDSDGISAKLTAVEVQKDFYVFNIDSDGGFVIVSGDDCVGDNLVLGYSEQGSFSTDNIPANMQAWLDDVAAQIKIMADNGAKAQRVIVHDDIAPMVTSKWGQRSPYNAMCPMKEGGQSVTGCMATALAQVMCYHRWPQQAVSGPLPAYVNNRDGAIEDELPSVTFDWDNMLDVYDDNATQEQCMAVATLMRYCGQVNRMGYTPVESNAKYIDLDMLVRSFSYSAGATVAFAQYYGVQSWYDLLYNELREGRPIVFSGISTGGGHAFVLDGYKVDDGEPYFHVNWGWDGDSDGFYKLTLMNPNSHGTGSSSTDDGYCNGQRAYIGLQPATASSSPYGLCLLAAGWNGTHNKVPGQMGVFNVAGHPATFRVAFAERQADGTPDLSCLYGEMTIETPAYDDAALEDCLRNFDLPGNIASVLAAGTHNLTVVYKEAETDAPWHEIFGPACTIEVTVKADGTTEPPIYHPCPKFSAAADDVHINGQMLTLLPHAITAAVDNSGDDAIESIDFSAYLLNDGILTSKETDVKSTVFAEAGTKSDILFEGVSFTKPGKYVGIITMRSDTPDFSGKNLDDVMADPAYIAHTLATIETLPFICQGVEYLGQQTNNSGMTVYAISCQLTNGTTMDYNSMIVAKIYSLTDDGQELVNLNGAGYATGLVDLAANTQGTNIIRFLNELQPGKYLVELQINKDFHANPLTSSQKSFITFATVPFTVSTTGIDSVQGSCAPVGARASKLGTSFKVQEVQGVQGDVWYDLQGRALPGKPTQKGIYLNNGRKISIY